MDEIVKSKNCSTKSLDIHSNLNIKDITAYFDHWKKFKKVSIYVSIDCPPSTYKYFRRNGDWNLVASNIKKIKNECSQVSVIGHLTFSLFGALRYKEIADTWEDMALEPNSSIVILGPTSSRYLSDPLKQSALSQMNEVLQNKDGKYSNGLVRMTDKCKTYLLNTESYGENIHHEVIGWCKLHDKKTNLQTLDFYPELKMYYNNNNVK
jgi:hypothetical protein